jgi:hypothetical protein
MSFIVKSLNSVKTDFHRTNYGVHEPMSSAMRQFNEVIGIFDFGLTRDQFQGSGIKKKTIKNGCLYLSQLQLGIMKTSELN